MFSSEVYETKIAYKQLPDGIQQLFGNLKQFYSEIQGGQLNIYFHDVVPSVRIGVKIGNEYKEYTI